MGSMGGSLSHGGTTFEVPARRGGAKRDRSKAKAERRARKRNR